MATHIELKNVSSGKLRILDVDASTTVVINPGETAIFKSISASLSGSDYGTAYDAGYISSANVTTVAKDHRPAPSWVGFRKVHPWWQTYDTTKSPWAVGWGVLTYSPLGVARDDKSEVAVSYTPMGGSGGSVVITGTSLNSIANAIFETLPESTTVTIADQYSSDTTVTVTAPAYTTNGPLSFGLYDVHGNKSKGTLTYYYGEPPAITGQDISVLNHTTAGSNFTVRYTGNNFMYGTTPYLFATAATSAVVDSIAVLSASAMNVVYNGGPAASAIAMVFPGYCGDASGTVTVVADPVQTSFSPLSGPLAGGTSLSIVGTGLERLSVATFSTTPSATAEVTGAAATSAAVATPASTAGGPILFTARDADGTNATGPDFYFYYGSAPTRASQSASAVVTSGAVGASACETSAAASGFTVMVIGDNFKYGTTDYIFGPTPAQTGDVSAITVLSASALNVTYNPALVSGGHSITLSGYCGSFVVNYSLS